MERLFLGSQAGDTCLAKLLARAVSRSAATGSVREVPTGSPGHEGGVQPIAREAIHSCQ